MKTYELEDYEVAAILYGLYPRYNDLVIELKNAKNPLIVASLKSKRNELKGLIKKLEEEN